MKSSVSSGDPASAAPARGSGFRHLDIREALSIFYRRRLLATGIVLVTLAGVVVGNYLTYPVFESRVKVLVERTGGPELPFSREQIAFKKSEITQTQCELLVSEPFLAETVRELGLDTRADPTGSLRDAFHAWVRRVLGLYGDAKQAVKRFAIVRVFGGTYEAPKSGDPFREAVDRLRSRVAAEPLPSTDMILLTVRDREAAMAARIATQLSKIYLTRDLDDQRARAREVYELIGVQVDAFKPKCDAAEAAVEAFEREHQARLLEEKTRTKIQEISSLQATHGQLLEDRESTLLTLNLELARLEETYSPNHPKVLAARSELAEAVRRLRDEPGPASQTSKAPEKRDRSLNALVTRIEQAKQELAELTLLEGQYSRLLRKKEQEEELYLYLKKKREEAQIAEATRASGTRIIEPAVVSADPRYPRQRLNLLLGLVGGLLAAGVVCAVLEYLDRSVRTPADVAQAAGVDVVWSIPDWRHRRGLPRTIP